MRIRTGTIAAAALGALVGVVLLLGPSAPESSPETESRRNAPVAAEAAVAPAPDAPGPDRVEPEPVAAEPGSTDVQLGVEVLRDDGSPAGGLVAYAWPAGRSGDSSRVAARSRTDDEGRAVLKLPGSGTYDIGCVDTRTHGHALVTDVVVPGGVVVRLVMPPTAILEIVPAPELELDGPLDLDLEVVGGYGVETRALPGRGQRLSTTGSVVLGSGGAGIRKEVVAGIPLRLTAPGIVTSPDPFFAPVTVTVSPSGQLHKMRVVVIVELPPELVSRTEQAWVDLRLVDGVPVRAGLIPLRVGSKGRKLFGSLTVRVPRPAGEIQAIGRVGDRVVEGRSRFSGLRPDKTTDVAITVR